MSPSFEMKAIRSWTRARRQKVDDNGKRGQSNRAKASPDLAAVLEAYDRRYESAAMEERTATEKQEQFRAEAARLIESVMAPTLREVGEHVMDHGHRFEIESRVDIMGQPAIVCAFSPRESSRNLEEANELSFRFHFPNRLLVSGAASDGTEMRDLTPRSYEVSDVTGEMMKAEATRFVSAVLK